MTTTRTDPIASDRPLIVVFSRATCAPCRMLKPLIEKVGREFAATHDIVRVDVDAQPEEAANHQVLNLPTVIVLRSGGELGRMIGFHPEPAVRALFASATDRP
jgi:thioredoxin-like negative regulator of GroEL